MLRLTIKTRDVVVGVTYIQLSNESKRCSGRRQICPAHEDPTAVYRMDWGKSKVTHKSNFVVFFSLYVTSVSLSLELVMDCLHLDLDRSVTDKIIAQKSSIMT
ncbi:hypothetical protein BgiBS90_026924 [Biomphalaria glabrata]|nr:hypothetical protein BgiBS90_026924 [Biomphalaria glabrata]